MLNYLTLILLCQLAGQLLTGTFQLPLPGPVAGMVFLFLFLLARGSVPSDLAGVADALLGALSLLFVPAGVGVMLHFGLLAQDWVPIAGALIISTILTITITAMMMAWLSRGQFAPDEE